MKFKLQVHYQDKVIETLDANKEDATRYELRDTTFAQLEFMADKKESVINEFEILVSDFSGEAQMRITGNRHGDGWATAMKFSNCTQDQARQFSDDWHWDRRCAMQ